MNVFAPWLHRLFLLLPLFFIFPAVAQTNLTIAATLHDQPIYLAELQPGLEELNRFRDTHSEAETAAWQLGVVTQTLSAKLLYPLGKRFMREKDLSPTETDIQNLQQMYEQLHSESKLSTRHATDWWRTWKFNQRVHSEFGGKCVLRVFGLEAVEAFGRYLEQEEKKGTFRIHSPTLRKGFYHYFTHATYHEWYEGDTAAWHQSAERAMFLAYKAGKK